MVVFNAEFYADFRKAILTKIRSANFSQIDSKVRHCHVPNRKNIDKIISSVAKWDFLAEPGNFILVLLLLIYIAMGVLF